MVVDSQGRPYVVWERYDTSPGVYGHKYTYRLPNGTWTTPSNIYPPGYYGYGDFSLTVDEEDIFHFAFRSQGGGVLNHAMFKDNVWSNLFQLNNMGDKVYEPKIVSDGLGNVHAVWGVHDPPGSEGFYSRRWNSETGWAPAQKIGTAAQIGNLAELVSGSDGTLYVGWVDLNRKIYVTSRDPYGYWSSPEIIGTHTGSFTGMKIVPDSNKRPHVIWTDDGAGQAVYVIQNVNGDWESPIILDNNVTEYNEPDINIDAANVLQITYNKFSSNKMYVGQKIVDTADTKTVYQVVQIPNEVTTPILSFMYQLGNAYGGNGSSGLLVEIDDGATTTPILELSQTSGPSWTHAFSDLSVWAGQTVTVSFTLEQAAFAPMAWTRIDEVTLGSGYPDLWPALGDGAGLPGEEVTIALTYGNQGGVTASGVHITQTLPTGLTFVSADVTPISTSPLVWDVGDVPAGSGPFTIMVTLRINNNAPPLVYLTSSVTIAPTGQELETANNTAQGQIYTGTSIYLPAVRK